jgi:hypothetical protein
MKVKPNNLKVVFGRKEKTGLKRIAKAVAY